MKGEELLKVLDRIDPAALSYQEWTDVGMALKHEGLTAYDWDSWSSRDVMRYRPGECYKKWDSFQSVGITGGTIVEYAKRQGWKGSRPSSYNSNEVLSWDSWITDEQADIVVTDRGWVETATLVEPGDDWKGEQDLIKYLETLFEPGEYVGYLTESREEVDGDVVKYKPSTQGVYQQTAQQIIDNLKRYKGNMPFAIGSWNPQAGAWIRFNPLDGKGVKNENVSAFRYALVESDSMDMGDQLAMIRALELPTAAIVSSGGKSVHAIVKIDAYNAEEYKQRVDYLYRVCEKNGLVLDKQNKNASRLSRMPGVTRGEHKQYLIGTHEGKDNFQQWQEWVEELNDDMGDPELPPEDGKRPKLKDELIESILRKGHKMLVAGPSKAGKSFLLLQLGLSISLGRPWLGRKCAQGKVLYVNLELDEDSAWARVYDILDEYGLEYSDLDDKFWIWNLRGKSAPMDKLASKLIRRAEKHQYDAIIIDPIYKVLTGDENNAADMALFANQFDKIATALNCAVIYCHHHSKGYQGGKKSMDRASGSGVFARDPDALLDMTELEVKPSKRDDYLLKPGATAWRIEGTLREFPSFEPIDCYFEYPVHRVDEEGALKDVVPRAEQPPWKNGADSTKEKFVQKAESDKASFEMQYANYTAFNKSAGMPLSEMCKYFEVKERTMRTRVEKYEGYYIKNNTIFFDESE